MQKKNTARKHRSSLILNATDRLTAFIYSLFFHGRIGDMLTSSNTLCRRSYLSGFFSKKSNVTVKRTALDYANAFAERSAIAKFLGFMIDFFAALKVHVYGAFFTFFGLSSTITHLILTIVNGIESVNTVNFVSSIIIAICSIPLLFFSSPAIEAISNSAFLYKAVHDILCIPQEKLRAKGQYGGTVYVFVAALVAIALGALSYVVSPIYFMLLFVCLIAVLAILSSPESGVIITLALLPFMQYMPAPTVILTSLLAITAASYVIKVCERKRTLSLSPEISMVLIFCGFILAGGFLSKGGL